MDDGSLLDVKWDSGYDGWSRADRVILTTESGDGYMYNDDVQTEVDVFLLQILATSPKIGACRMEDLHLPGKRGLRHPQAKGSAIEASFLESNQERPQLSYHEAMDMRGPHNCNLKATLVGVLSPD